MKLIDSNVKLIEQESGIEGIYKAIEHAGRICYASEPKGDPEAFVKALVKRGHHSPLEFGTVYLSIPINTNEGTIMHYSANKYSKVKIVGQNAYITTNYRVLVENDWLDTLFFLTEPTEHHERRYFFQFTCSEAIAREFNRHRVNSICQQSTRYCNFSKDKFGNEITFIKPYWYSGLEFEEKDKIFEKALEKAEYSYLKLIKEGCQPQEAREVLPLATKTELCQCAFKSDWDHFLELRTAAGAHPDARVLAEKVKNLIYAV